MTENVKVPDRLKHADRFKRSHKDTFIAGTFFSITTTRSTVWIDKILVAIQPIANWAGSITKTFLYSVDPLKPHFLYSKTGVYRGILYFSYFCSKHRLCVLVTTASLRRLKRVPTIYVLSKNMKNVRNFSWNVSFFGGKIFSIFE